MPAAASVAHSPRYARLVAITLIFLLTIRYDAPRAMLRHFRYADAHICHDGYYYTPYGAY